MLGWIKRMQGKWPPNTAVPLFHDGTDTTTHFTTCTGEASVKYMTLTAVVAISASFA